MILYIIFIQQIKLDAMKKTQDPHATGGTSHQQRMTTVFQMFQRRCDGINSTSVDKIPGRIDYILSTSQTATQPQAAAANQCCCPLCMQMIFDGTKYVGTMCSICSRRCCDVCSHNDGHVVICNSQTCAVKNRFNRGELSPRTYAATLEETSKRVIRQWLVLQNKNEADLGPLRALYLIDAKNAAIESIQVVTKSVAEE